MLQEQKIKDSSKLDIFPNTMVFFFELLLHKTNAVHFINCDKTAQNLTLKHLFSITNNLKLRLKYVENNQLKLLANMKHIFNICR